jgi:two-component sensor histidine kinase
VNKDSVFLNIHEVLEPNGTIITRFFIDKINLVNGHIDSSVNPVGFYDRNGDGKKEFYFAILSGYSVQPRQVYYFDLENRQLKKSAVTGINFNNPRFEDIDNDGSPEIFGTINASGNHRTQTPYTDHSAWLVVLNADLELKFPPVEFPGFGGSLQTFYFGSEKEKKLVAVYNYLGTSNRVPYQAGVYEFSVDGAYIRHRAFDDYGFENRQYALIWNKDHVKRLVFTAQSLTVMNQNLEIEYNQLLDYSKPEMRLTWDIDQDGSDELLLYANNPGMLTILNTDLKLYGHVPMQAEPDHWKLSHLVTTAGEKKAFIHAGDYSYTLQLRDNPYYLLTYLVYPAVYFAFVLFIGFIKQVTTRQVEKQEELKRRLQTLQLRSVKSQLDPHFMFNALNSVASLLYQDDRKGAYDYLNKFTRLLRQLLSDTERIYRTLEEEIQFVDAYLKLEKLRFSDKFEYTITVGDGINRHEKVPVMVLQTFTENAIKHGLMPLTSGGKLTIAIEQQDDYLKIIIEDNGVGRARAAETGEKGLGLKMITEFYEILNQDRKKPIRYEIHDLYSGDGKPCGTRVEVNAPVENFN